MCSSFPTDSARLADGSRSADGTLPIEGGVLQRLNAWAEHSPHQPALTSVDGSQSFTYRELVREVAARAAAVRTDSRCGGEGSSRVLVVSDSSLEAYLTILACMWAGCVVAIADAEVPEATLQAYTQAIRPDFILRPGAGGQFGSSEYEAKADPATAGGVQGSLHRESDAIRDGEPQPEPLPVPAYEPERAQIMLFTSGTTGTPKAVVLPERSFLAVPDLIRREGLDWITWQPGEVTYTPLPSSHIGGLWWSFNGLASGCHVIAGRTSDALGALQRWRVNTTCMVPTLMGMLTDQLRKGTALPPDVRLVVYGGSRAIAADVRMLEEHNVRTAQIYGLSESGCTAVCLPTSKNVAGSGKSSLEFIESGAVGQPYPGVQVCVLNDVAARPPKWHGEGEGKREGEAQHNHAAIHPASDQHGTLWIRTPAGMLGYFGNEDQTRATIHNGWINTGDRVALHQCDSDSTPIIYLRGRVSELIICGGANVNPDEVDAIAMSVPGVLDAAAFAIPDPTFGELVGLAVIPAEPNSSETNASNITESAEPNSSETNASNITESAAPKSSEAHALTITGSAERELKRTLARHFRAHASSESRPAHIFIVDSLPRTASGKIQRHELQKQFRRHEKKTITG